MRTVYIHEQQERYRTLLSYTADQNIELDLDDGAKVNYAKFGDVLARINKTMLSRSNILPSPVQ